MKILLFPYAKAMRNGKEHPKNWPYWSELVGLLEAEGHQLTQLGVEGEPQLVADFRKGLSYSELVALVEEYDTWISVDSYGQHVGWSAGKRGVAIFGQSDPLIFGHDENINLLKDRRYLRDKQFWLWEQCDFRSDVWVKPDAVVEAIKNNFATV